MVSVNQPLTHNEMPYKHITRDERIKIEAYIEAGYKAQDIANMLGRSKSTISRELQRNYHEVAGLKYRAKFAEARRLMVRQSANQQFKKILDNSRLAQTIEDILKQYWSPEQIAGRLKVEHDHKTIVCHETIYRYIFDGHEYLRAYLRNHKGKYRKKRGQRNIKQNIPVYAQKKRIDRRPLIVEERARIGDFEGDTIVGKERIIHILTHVDRKSGFLFADKLDTITADHTSRITVKRFNKLPKYKRRTITYDNGVQFNEYKTTEHELKIPIYFANPYHSWERGTNENTNGLVRQFFPKGSEFKNIKQRQINYVANLINHRPRKRLNYQTPDEVFNK